MPPASSGRSAAVDACSRTLLQYAIVFFVLALIPATVDFTGGAAGAAGIAKTLFVVFLVRAVGGFLRGLRPRLGRRCLGSARQAP